MMTALEGCQSGAAAWRARATRARRWARESWAVLAIAALLVSASGGAAFFQRRYAIEQQDLRAAKLTEAKAKAAQPPPGWGSPGRPPATAPLATRSAVASSYNAFPLPSTRVPAPGVSNPHDSGRERTA
jgi:hypothetical protein